MFEKIKEFFGFSSDEPDELVAEKIFADTDKNYPIYGCKLCNEKEVCEAKDLITVNKNAVRNHIGYEEECVFKKELANYTQGHDTFFIIDDNEGIVSFLEDDLEFFHEEKILDLGKINVLALTGSHSAFSFELIQKKTPNLNIKWAVIDITLGGSIMTSEGNIKYTGVDVFKILIENNPDVKFLFYTGNNLNPYIKGNKKIIDQFHNITNKNISDYILFKTSMDIDIRRKYIAKTFFEKELNI